MFYNTRFVVKCEELLYLFNISVYEVCMYVVCYEQEEIPGFHIVAT